MFFRLLSLFAIVATAAPAGTQAIAGDAQTQLLTAARNHYVNLNNQGLKSFSCNVDINWDDIFKQTGGSALPAENPLMIYLVRSRLGVRETIASGAEVTWANSGRPPDEVGEMAGQVRGAVQQMLQSFFEAWTPNINGQLFLSDVISAKSTDKGYEIEEKIPGNGIGTLTFDKNLVLGHITSISDDHASEIEVKYSPTQQGLLLSGVAIDSRRPPTAPSRHVDITTDYQTVDGFQLPASIGFSVKGVGTINLKLSGCIVEKTK
jgi:hypothetical protein